MSFVFNFLRRYGIVTDQQAVERDPDHVSITHQNLQGRQRGAGLPDALLMDGDNNGGNEEEGTHDTRSADEDGDGDEDQGIGKRRRRAESTERSTRGNKRRRYQSPREVMEDSNEEAEHRVKEDLEEEVEEEHEHDWIPDNPPLWAECPVCFEDKICGWRRSCNCAGFCSWRCGWTAVGRWEDGEQAETTNRPPAAGISKLCSYCGQNFDFVHRSFLTSGLFFVAQDAETAAGWRRR